MRHVVIAVSYLYIVSVHATDRALVHVQITRGLLQKYGAERVRDTPITEVRPSFVCMIRALSILAHVPGWDAVCTCPRRLASQA